MGGLKEQYLKGQEEHYVHLAHALGITWEDMLALEYEVTANMSKDGLIYGYVVSFRQENDKNILSKVHGLDSNLAVHLPPWALERSAEDEYELSAIFDNTEYKSNFLRELNNLDRLQKIEIDDVPLRQILLRQLFISIIGAVEAYLSDAFINKTLSSDFYLENFVKTHPEFNKQKISVSEIFDAAKNIKERAKTIMASTIYHKLPQVKEMYQKTFNINFPDISEIQKYILQRHDFVHRNGKTTDGKMVTLDDATVTELKRVAIDLVHSVSNAIDSDNLPFSEPFFE